MGHYIGILGVVAILSVAYGFSDNRQAIHLRTVISAFLLQAGFAFLILYVPLGKAALAWLSQAVQFVISFSDAGITFLFGEMANVDKMGFVFAVKVLPIIVFFSSLMSVLYYLHIMQWVIRTIGGLLRYITGTQRVEALNAAANIFVGQTDAPLVVRPYISSISKFQLYTIMVSGTASISGSLLTGYASMGISLEYLLAASFMSAPGGLLMAKLMMPDPNRTEEPLVEAKLAASDAPGNIIAAVAEGAMKGLTLAVSIGAMLIAFVSLIALLNGLSGLIFGLVNIQGVTFEVILGYLFSPFVYLMGVPAEEMLLAGNLIGQKFILNEFVAYVNFIEVQDQLSPHSQAILTFALCGFANLSSIAVLIGGLGSIAPDRRHDVASMGLKAVLAGTLSNLMSACLAGLMLA